MGMDRPSISSAAGLDWITEPSREKATTPSVICRKRVPSLVRSFSTSSRDSGFTNQDRYFSLRLRALKEGQFWKYMPAVVVGTSDPFTSSGNGVVAPTEGNGYFSRFYIAATRHVQLGRETVGVHLSYLYNKRIEYKLNGIAAGISYNPSFHPQLRLIAEYDSKDFALGATYLLFNHLHAQVELQRMKYFTGGLTFQFRLSGKDGMKKQKRNKELKQKMK